MVTKKMISVVLPSYNEEKNIPLVYDEVVKHIKDTGYNLEIIFVNDGSRDGTWEAISKLSKIDVRVKGLNFSRNFGHHAALQAGLEAAQGDAVIMLDADLQHPPALIPELIREWENGNDIVNTVRLATHDIGVLKSFSSTLFYRMLNTISDLHLNDGEADYRLIDRRALNALNAMPESPKFYRGLVNWVGFNVARVDYEAAARQHGKSSYTLKKMLELARLGLTSFSLRPLKFIISFGATVSTLSFLGLAVMIFVKFFIDATYFSNNAILVMFLVFMTGILSTFQGIVAIYLVDIFNAAKGRPTYIISEQTK